MAEKPEQKNRIMDGIHILKKAQSSFSRREVQKMEAILYAFAVKFLNNEDLTVVKEAIAMTKLGQMIWDDAVKEGERIGRKEGERIGQKEASERYSRLILLLSKEKKDDLIIKIASDPEYREEMYKKYGI